MKKNNKYKFLKITITKLLIPCAIFFIFLGILILGLRSFIDNDLYFRIKKVNFIGLDDRELANKISHQFLYDNIFKIDIKKIRDDIKNAYPEFYYVEPIKNFPDELTIKMIRRRPLAQIKQGGFYLVDSEGVIVSDASRNPFNEFIVISGLKDTRSISFGKKINSKELKSSLILVEDLNKIREKLIPFIARLSDNKNMSVELSRYPTIYVYLGDLELRFHKDYLNKEINLFRDILVSLDKKINQVKYIDLRFDNPAVSFKK